MSAVSKSSDSLRKQGSRYALCDERFPILNQVVRLSLQLQNVAMVVFGMTANMDEVVPALSFP
jgi:hypothetical protein